MRFTIALAICVSSLVACRQDPPPAKVATPQPTCQRKMFDAAVDRFDTLTARRDEAIKRVEAYPDGEPAEYLRNLEDELRTARARAADAQVVVVPKCLLNARAIYVRAWEQTLAALDARRPSEGGGFPEYEQASQGAKATLEMFDVEVKQQARNVE